MRVITTSLPIKNISLAVASVLAAVMLVISWFAMSANAASGIIRVTSNIADVPGGANLVLTVGTKNDGDVHELEIDHSLSASLPEFSVYANEANPYGGATCGAGSNLDCRTQFQASNVSVSYSAADNQWVIDFGPTVTNAIRANGDINFYLVLRDASDNILWGSMNTTTPENTFEFDAVAGTGESLLVAVDEDDEEAVVPGVPNTSVGR